MLSMFINHLRSGIVNISICPLDAMIRYLSGGDLSFQLFILCAQVQVWVQSRNSISICWMIPFTLCLTCKYGPSKMLLCQSSPSLIWQFLSICYSVAPGWLPCFSWYKVNLHIDGPSALVRSPRSHKEESQFRWIIDGCQVSLCIRDFFF